MVSPSNRDLLPLKSEHANVEAWSEHWSNERQRSLAQIFFSFYRKAVFARTVRYLTNHYFPPSGRFLEAGSGTSETSMRINKRGGDRRLIALDIVLPVLRRSHPVMDQRICGDIFQVPCLSNSIDGIWNVGVMEHFTHEEIDRILKELYRILKPGGRLILLWPGADSVPQKFLRAIETIINLKAGQKNFSFHPAEISQLKSKREGYDILARNGFRCLYFDYGFLSLMAFKILVGVKQ